MKLDSEWPVAQQEKEGDIVNEVYTQLELLENRKLGFEQKPLEYPGK